MDGGGGELTLILPKIHSNNPGEQAERVHHEIQKQSLLQALSLQTEGFGGRCGGPRAFPPLPLLSWNTLRGSQHLCLFPDLV